MDKKQIFIQVYTNNGKFYLEGNSLLKLNLKDRLQGNLDQLYEFQKDELNEIIMIFNNVNQDVVARAYTTAISNEELNEKLDTNDMEKTSWDELYRDAITMGKTEEEAIKYADEQTINND